MWLDAAFMWYWWLMIWNRNIYWNWRQLNQCKKIMWIVQNRNVRFPIVIKKKTWKTIQYCIIQLCIFKLQFILANVFSYLFLYHQRFLYWTINFPFSVNDKIRTTSVPVSHLFSVQPLTPQHVRDSPLVNDFDDEESIRDPVKRETWSRGVEFLFSCIAMSVGLGNLWRFPAVAYNNGGGAFLIPYIIVLLIIGRPGYFLEMIVGQFSSRGTIKVYDCAPAMRGVGTGQVLASMFVATYYSSIMGLTLKFLFDSFNFVLPWTVCREEYGEKCVSSSDMSSLNRTGYTSSADLYLKWVRINQNLKSNYKTHFFSQKIFVQRAESQRWNWSCELEFSYVFDFFLVARLLHHCSRNQRIWKIFIFSCIVSLRNDVCHPDKSSHAAWCDGWN